MSKATVERVLIIRFHAIGDTAITLPACSALRVLLPHTPIDYLTTRSAAPLVEALDIFDEVLLFPDCNTRVARLSGVVRTAAILRLRRYRLVLDLQSNWVSKAIRMLLRPSRWSEFDRTSPLPAGKRVVNVFHDAGYPQIISTSPVKVSPNLIEKARVLLHSAGWDEKRPLVLLNPAGLWKSRNWPDRYYGQLAQLMSTSWNCQILFVGTDRARQRVRSIQEAAGLAGIDLIGRTRLDEAMGVLTFVSLVISEDSGLMHMAWTSGIPTIALLGSTRHDWSAPLGTHTRCFHSGDLPCGPCRSPECRYGDTHCLTRVTPAQVFTAGRDLMATHGATNR